MGFNIMDLMNGATRAAVEGVDNYEASNNQEQRIV